MSDAFRKNGRLHYTRALNIGLAIRRRSLWRHPGRLFQAHLHSFVANSQPCLAPCVHLHSFTPQPDGKWRQGWHNLGRSDPPDSWYQLCQLSFFNKVSTNWESSNGMFSSRMTQKRNAYSFQCHSQNSLFKCVFQKNDV
jgi:hypothetical protein